MGALLSKYSAALVAQPLLTKAITASVMNATEELVSQSVTGDHDVTRIIQMSIYGFMIKTPLSHYLYAGLDRSMAPLAAKGPKGTPVLNPALLMVLQILIANIVFTPIQNYVYLYALTYIAGKRGHDQIHKIVMGGLQSLNKISWQISPVVQILTFKFVPQILWVPVFNTVGLVFGIVFNILSKKKTPPKPKSD